MTLKDKIDLLKRSLPINEEGLVQLEKAREREATRTQISLIERWFTEYDRKTIEHMRCIRLNIECHHNIDELDAEAIQKQKLIQVLRNKLKELTI